MKTLYLKQSIHLQQEFAKYMAFILNAIYCKLLIKFNGTGHLPLKQIHYCLVLSLICKYTLSLIRVFQTTSQTHMNTHASTNIYIYHKY